MLSAIILAVGTNSKTVISAHFEKKFGKTNYLEDRVVMLPSNLIDYFTVMSLLSRRMTTCSVMYIGILPLSDAHGEAW